VLRCPFCGSSETDRFDLEGQRFIVFACMFTPAVDAGLDERALAEHLATAYRPDGSGPYFRQVCDRLHRYVTQGEGGLVLTGRAADPSGPG
jgi:hypothetical protein